jgi:hypothetical protein
MSRRTETILIVLAGALALLLLTPFFSFDLSNARSVPFWFWLLFALFVGDMLVVVVLRGLRSTPSRSEVVTNLVTAVVFLFLYSQSPENSVLRPGSVIMALYFLAIAGIRFILLVGRKPA